VDTGLENVEGRGMFRKVLWIKERFIKVLRDGGIVYESVVDK